MNRAREVPTTRARIGLAGAGNKRKADISPKKVVEAKKRSALGDLTNATKKKAASLVGKDGGKDAKQAEKTKEVKPDKPSLIPIVSQQEPTRVTRAKSKSLKDNEEPLKKVEAPEPVKSIVAPDPSRVLKDITLKPIAKVTRRSKTLAQKTEADIKEKDAKKNEAAVQPSSSSLSEEDSLYQTAVSTPESSTDEALSKEEVENKNNELLTQKLKSLLPAGVKDFDEETGNDPFQVALYAPDIFAYYKRRELRFPIRKYLDRQTELNKNMRSILVDWMVEVQESFEMNHETLYLAVKLVDLFLSRSLVKREKLQLVGTTALYIAAKYDERCPPVIDDFCYICDDAYSHKEVNLMEEKMLRVLKFDIGMPLSYRFLRRYARCARLDMEVLTLARYILEMSLMEYDFIDTIDSMMAAAALLLALKMIKVDHPWTPTLRHYSSYAAEELFDLTHRLYDFMQKPQAHLKTIRSKYSHKVFYEVAKIQLPEELKL